MTAIYTHLRPDQFTFSDEFNHSDYVYKGVPEYANLSINQTKHFLQTQPILIENEIVNKEYASEVNEFFLLCKQNFPSFYKDPFWFLTLARLYIVYLYCKKHNITKFIHLEYDNLIYSDLKVLDPLPSSIYFTRVGPFCSSAGFVYCNSLDHFEKFINKVIQLIKKGEKTIRTFTQYDHLSEMIMIDLIHTHTTDVMSYLPILPFGTGNDNFDKLNVLFDGASYGQFLGGTNNGHDKGWYGTHQYVGVEIAQKTLEVTFEDKAPYVVFDNKKIPILNLHVHSKKLEKFIL
jgi:hypothetical protein